MTRLRWVNGDQVSYGGSSWYRFVLDVDLPGDGSILVWWGVESAFSLSDSSNVGDTSVNGSATPFNNVNFQHGSGGGVTWLRSETFWINPGATISVSGYVANLAGVGGGSGASASWTRDALPPNQMFSPVITNIAATTHQAHYQAPGTNGTPITSYSYEYYFSGGAGGVQKSGTVTSSPIYMTGMIPNQAYAVRIAANSAAGRGPWSGYTNFMQAVAVPGAPSALTVTRGSDTSQNLTWTRAGQSQGPYASQEILRGQGLNGTIGPFSVVATLSGSATSYTDTTTVANRVYQYQVRASNASGTTTSGYSSYVFTTPGLPTSAVAAKGTTGNIVLTWNPPTGAALPHVLKYEVSESTDGGATWTVLGTTAKNVTTYTHVSPNSSVPHRYRLRAVADATGWVGTGLTSGYTQTNTVQLLAPPLAPTNLLNTPAGTVDRAQAIVLSWQHNSVDSSAQTKYTLQHRRVGTTTWTTVGPNAGAESSYTLPANAYPTGVGFEWQVKTWGLHPDESPYSAVATVQISSVPGVNITSPANGSVVGATLLTVLWTYNDPDGDPQGSWEAILFAADGQVLETRSGANTATSTTFTYRMEETAYSVKVRVRDSRGLWSSQDVRNFTVAYPPPPTPVINGHLWDWRNATVELSFTVPAPTGSQVAPVYLEIWRSIDGAPYQRLIADLPPLAVSYLDTTPTVDGTNTYLLVAVSDLPSVAQSNPEDAAAIVTTPEIGDGRPAVWINAGTGFTNVGRLATEVSVESGRIRERVLQRYAGRPLPVEHSGEHVDETWRVSGVLNITWSAEVDAADSPEKWLALGALPGPFLLRAPSLFGGRTIYTYVSLDGPTVSRAVGGNTYQVSFTATRTEA